MKNFSVTVLIVMMSTTLYGGEKMKNQTNPTAGKGEACTLPQNDDELKKLLTPEQYEVTKRNATEAPFANKYWNNHHPGIYVDVISQEALFSSKDKFDSGSGWPSFTKPIKTERIAEKKDVSHGMTRVEVRSKKADSHLGHVFNDGPGPNGLRFCINSLSLRFVPLERLKEEGYSQYLDLFEQKDWDLIKKLGNYKE